MSMHKIQLTDLEHSGLLEHHLPIGKPSQLSDCFRLGIQYATRNFNETVIQLCKEKGILQAKIDSLMLEFHCRRVPVSEAQSPSCDQDCPEEMTKEQLEVWEDSQVVSNHSITGSCLDKLLDLNPISREIYGSNTYKPNKHCYWDYNYGCWTEDDSHYRIRIKDLLL